MPDSPTEFLTPDESAAVDRALLTTRDKFLTRVAIYSLRSLKQISAATGLAVEEISQPQVADWINRDPNLQQEISSNPAFQNFFTQLVLSSLKPLRQAAQAKAATIADLTVADVIAYFEQDARTRLEQNQGGA